MLHPCGLHTGAVDVHVQGAPIRAWGAPREEVGLARCSGPNRLLAMARAGDVPRRAPGPVRTSKAPAW
eukprot:3427110-Alexandrium_andersonii.AAC.1